MRFYTLRHYFKVEAFCDRQEPLDNHVGRSVFTQTRDETPVDLQLIQRNLPKMLKRSVPCTKVVDR